MTDGGAGASTVPTTVHLLPDGEFTPADGRILVCGRWVLTAVIAAAVIALANAQINDFVIDYEHQTQLSADNGQPALALACLQLKCAGLSAPASTSPPVSTAT